MAQKKVFTGSGKVHHFYVPFVVNESVVSNAGTSCMSIQGCAISETTTRNGHTFLAEELMPSAQSLCNKPLLKDHVNSVDNIVGRTTEKCYYDGINKCVVFEANVMDADMCQKIKSGLVNSVSVGAMVRQAECVDGEDGSQTYIMRGIDFVELSLVAVPADPNAGFANALAESFALVESPAEEKPMSEEIKSKLADHEAIIEKLQLEIKQLAAEKLQLEKAVLEAETAKLRAQPTQESVAPKSETKGEVATAQESTTKEDLPFTIIEKDVIGKYGLELNYSNSSRMVR